MRYVKTLYHYWCENSVLQEMNGTYPLFNFFLPFLLLPFFLFYFLCYFFLFWNFYFWKKCFNQLPWIFWSLWMRQTRNTCILQETNFSQLQFHMVIYRQIRMGKFWDSSFLLSDLTPKTQTPPSYFPALSAGFRALKYEATPSTLS